LIAILEVLYTDPFYAKPEFEWRHWTWPGCNDLGSGTLGPKCGNGKQASNSDNGKVLFYNVMCIGWQDDTAHRRGLGKVRERDSSLDE
jgi:hypothetical protein